MATRNKSRELLRVPKQARSRERVERVLEAASALIAEKGCAGLKIGELAAAADVTAGSIYQYFDNKAGVITALAERHVEANRQAIEQAFAEPPRTAEELAETTTRLIEFYYDLYRNDPVVRGIWSGAASNEALAELQARDTEMCVALVFERSKHLFAPRHHGAVRRAVLLVSQFADVAVETAVAADPKVGRKMMDEAQVMLTACWDAAVTPLLLESDPD